MTTETAQRVGRIAEVSGIVAAISLAFLLAMFASFAAGATVIGLVFGWINDVLAVVTEVLMLPIAVALHVLLRASVPRLSLVAMWIGIAGMLAIAVLQTLLVLGILTFEEEIGPVSIAFLPVVAWFVLTGYLGSSSGVLPRGLRMGILGATYAGRPIWAFWLARRLRSLPIG